MAQDQDFWEEMQSTQPQVSREEDQERNSTIARQAEEEESEDIAEDMREGTENAGIMQVGNEWEKNFSRIKVVSGVITGLTKTARSH